MPPRIHYLVVDTETVGALTNLKANSIYQAAQPKTVGTRMKLNMQDLDSIITWLCAHGKPELRRKWAAHAAPAFLEAIENPAALRRERKP